MSSLDAQRKILRVFVGNKPSYSFEEISFVNICTDEILESKVFCLGNC